MVCALCNSTHLSWLLSPGAWARRGTKFSPGTSVWHGSVANQCVFVFFQSTVIVEKSIQDLMSLMQDLSAYSNQFLEMVCDKLKEYKEICNTAYR